MPREKDLKRIVRSRMQKTGESYTAARVRVLQKETAAPPLPDYAALAGMSDQSVEKQTGKNWLQWVAALDRFGAATKPHREIAAHLHSVGVPDWWSQMVAVGYERIRGLRAIGQGRSGTWQVSRSRTFDVPIARLFAAFADARKRRRWLAGAKPTVRTSIAGKSMRLTWDDGTLVMIGFTRKSESRSQVAISHTKLREKSDVERIRSYWSERLDALGEFLSRQRT